MCLGCDYYVTIECAQTICAPLLQNAQYATEVRRFSAHTRNRCVMKITKYPDVLALHYCPLFNTHFAIDFSERAIQGNIDRSILLTARMGRYGVKVALLRCLIRLIIILYCMAMRGILEYIAQARTILQVLSYGRVQYGPSASNIFWYSPNIRPCNIIIIHIRHFV